MNAVRLSVRNNSIYKKTLLYDIPRLFQIRRPDELAFLYTVLIRESSNLLDMHNLARDAGISRLTVSTYLDCLKEAFLHAQLTNGTASTRESRRLLKKGYVPSPNFMAALLKLDRRHPLWFKEVGHLVETHVAYMLGQRYSERLHFYRKGDREVDFLVTHVPGRLEGSLPIEVKYTRTVDPRDLKELVKLGQKARAGRLFCITKDRIEIRKSGSFELVFLPAWALV